MLRSAHQTSFNPTPLFSFSLMGFESRSGKLGEPLALRLKLFDANLLLEKGSELASF